MAVQNIKLIKSHKEAGGPALVQQKGVFMKVNYFQVMLHKHMRIRLFAKFDIIFDCTETRHLAIS